MSTAAVQKPNPPTVNAKLIMPFVNSVRSVFATMVKVPTTLGKPHLKTEACASHDVSSIIGFSGDIVGCVVVSLQMKAAEQVVSAFAGMPIAATSPDFADAVGELANMVAGAAKKDLGHAARISIPSVVIGAGHIIARLSDVPCIVIPCQTPVGDFAVEVSIKAVAST
jgi:chemotaxis protein CheX